MSTQFLANVEASLGVVDHQLQTLFSLSDLPLVALPANSLQEAKVLCSQHKIQVNPATKESCRTLLL